MKHPHTPALVPVSTRLPSRSRRLLALAAPASLLTAALPPAARASETRLSAELRNRKYLPDGISIDFPPLADTGNAVPITVEVQAPAGLEIRSIEILLPENPFPPAIKLNLPKPKARYRFSTRLRLASSQDAWVIATFSDGSQRGAFAPTVITSSACFDET